MHCRFRELPDHKTTEVKYEQVSRQAHSFPRKRCERKQLRHRHASYPEFSGSSSDDEDTSNMKWTTIINTEERSTKLGGVISRVRYQNVRKTIHSPHSDRSGRRKSLSLKVREKTSTPLPDIETIVISSSTSEGELDTNPQMTRNGLSIIPISFPPSPQSDLGEDMEQDLATILENARSRTQLCEIDTYTPASPSSLNSPRDSSPDLSDDDASRRLERWTLDDHTECRFGNDNLFHGRIETVRIERVERPRKYRRNSNPPSILDPSNSDMSDFEEVLNKSTAIALSQDDANPSSDESIESDEELPVIDYYQGETMEADACWDHLDGVEPPVLGKYGQSPTRCEVDNHTSFFSDVEDSSSKVSTSETEDHLKQNQIPSSPLVNCPQELIGLKVRANSSAIKGTETSPQHICIKSQSKSGINPTRLTSHMMNLIEACHDEHFIDASVALIGTFTTTRLVPSSETINYLLKSVLLGSDILEMEACQAYQILQHINRLHPVTSQTFEIDWELLSEIICGLIRTTISSEQTSKAIVLNTDRSLLALKFIVCVMENSVSCSRSMDSSGKTFALERHMIKDVLLWLEESIALYPLRSFRNQQLVQQLVEQLQKIISISCLEEHGDHLNYVTFSLVHKLDELSLQQKQSLIQTSCHKLRCKLVELYLETRYEVPSCPACRTDCSKVYLPQRLSIAKIFVLHIHQRPLVATQNVNDEKDFVEEETGERVHHDEKFDTTAGIDEESAVRGHCMRCSKRVPLEIEQCEEFILLLLSLLQSFIVCANTGGNLSKRIFSTFTDEDIAVLRRLKEHIDTLSRDLLLSCSKHSPRTLLYLKQMALFQDTFT